MCLQKSRQRNIVHYPVSSARTEDMNQIFAVQTAESPLRSSLFF